MTDDSKRTAMRAALMELSDVTSTVLEAATGYKSQCIAAGFPEKVADEMAVAYHAEVVRLVFLAMTKSVK